MVISMNMLKRISTHIQATETSKYITQHLKTTSPHSSLKILSVALTVLAHIAATPLLISEVAYKNFFTKPDPTPRPVIQRPLGGADLGPVEYASDEEDSTFDKIALYFQRMWGQIVKKPAPRVTDGMPGYSDYTAFFSHNPLISIKQPFCRDLLN